ncbi:sugar ABC transporter permease [Martelella sp. HB161492]|uniref:carbohydrate ABC transporter permease n=1 Tax=Martelella sp. HB161492 TaxID=2720726 RepID=UPI001591E836|nr:sugar ABC transporter permease [Martelella sp. HB161492]
MAFATRRRLFLIAMALPVIIYVLVVGVWPLAQGIFYSLYDYNLIRPKRTKFVGLENYVEILTDRTSRQALINTALFTVGAVFFELVLGFILALALWKDDRFNRIVLALILVPVTITPLVVGLIFKGLLASDYGMIGYYLAQWGLTDPRGLFADTRMALATLIFVDVWEWTPLVTLILLAGLKALPGDILEAASVDGATGLQKLRIIVLPLMLPAVLLALILRTVDAFRVFDSVYVTTGGGPGNATNTLMLHAVKQGLEFFNIGYASAIANLTLLIIAVIATVFSVTIRYADRRANGR